VSRTVLLFAKPPRIGLAKTRLARGVGPAAAQRIARMTMATTIRAATDRRWTLSLYTAPDPYVSVRTDPLWPPGLDRFSQGRGNLGHRLDRAFADAPAGPVLFIGADCPGLTAALLWRAFKGLASHDAVFGPADDGGFWLFGLTKTYRSQTPFSGVRWSTPDTLSDVLANLPASARTHALPTLLDIDTATDWKAWQARKS